MTATDRFVIKISGESGQGINSVGEILAKALKQSGYETFGYREYPSLIRGGVASYQLDISSDSINSSMSKCNMLLSISRKSLHTELKNLANGGILLHSIVDLRLSKDEQEFIAQNNIKLEYLNAEQEAIMLGGRKIMANVILIGKLWGIMGLDISILESNVLEKFAKKKDYIEINKKCVNHGYTLPLTLDIKVKLPKSGENKKGHYIISGNHALALGAISAGMRAYYAYPMTPSSSILSYLAETYKETGILVKQAEDEISAVQMALGSMYMGTRSMTGTSGGGFDLMTETLSLSGITEIPLVVVLAQRPGPATGLPTWTAAGDLNLVINAGHGEFPRAVLAVSDPKSAFALVQHAFNLSEKYQIPVILLTDKQIAESLFQIESLPEPLKIERGLLTDEASPPVSSDRYKFTESGVSDRWLPDQFEATYNSNSDEHTMDGSITEDSEPAIAMMDKRMKKLESLYEEFPEPELYGNPEAKHTVVGWGSVKSVILDVLEHLKSADRKEDLNYLHYEFIYPFRKDKISELIDSGSELYLIENNYSAQLGGLIAKEVGFKIKTDNQLLKYDGRPFFVEEVYKFISNIG